MKTALTATAILAFAAGAGTMAEYQRAKKPPLVRAAKPTPVPALHAERPPNPQERLAEIERLLSTPLTGSPEDTDSRSTLRGERDVLTGRTKATARHAGPFIQTVSPASQKRKNDVGCRSIAKSFFDFSRICAPN